VPDYEAEYPGGFTQITDYYLEHVIKKVSEKKASDKIGLAIIKFTVNEAGKIADAQIFKTSTDPTIDKLLLEATHKMPLWKPAKNSHGMNVKQEFIIPLGMGGC
jgi:TonB family protein